MPSKFTGSLKTDEPVNYEPPIRHDDSIQTLLDAGKTVANAYIEHRDTKTLESLTKESTGVLGEVVSYEQRKRELLLASSGADQQHLEQYGTELARLRSGELQGRISPAMATAKIAILSKETQKRWPHLETQIRAVTDQSISGIRAISAESDKLDPDVKAAYDTLEKAAAQHQTPEDYIADQAAARRLEQSKKTLETAQLLGQGLETATRAHTANFTTVAINEVLNGLVASARAGTVIKEDEVAQLAGLQSNLTRSIGMELTKQELETGAKFSQGFRDSLLKEVNDQLATITTMANNMDTVDKQRKFLAWAEEKTRLEGKMQVYKDLGTLGVLATLGSNPVDIYKSALSFKYQIEHNMRPQIEKLAEGGDTDSQFFLNALDSGFLPKFAMPNMDKAGRGEPTKSSGNKLLDKAGQGFVLNAIGDPKIPLKTRQNYAKSLIYSRGMFSNGLETALEHRGTIPFIQSDPVVQTAVVESVDNETRAGMHSLTPESAPYVVYNSVKKQFEVDPAYVQQLKSEAASQTRFMPYGAGGGLPTRLPAGVQETVSTANLGIRAYTLMGKDVPAYVKSVFDKINSTVNPTGDTAEEPYTPKPKVELTPEQMDQADTDFNSVIADLKARKLTGAQATLKMKEIAAKYSLD